MARMRSLGSLSVFIQFLATSVQSFGLCATDLLRHYSIILQPVRENSNKKNQKRVITFLRDQRSAQQATSHTTEIQVIEIERNM